MDSNDPVEIYLKALGAELRERRRWRGKTQAELGVELGLSAYAVGEMERGKTANLRTILAYAYALEADPAQLVARAQEIAHRERDGAES